jgi:DNA-binding MarR family transcriptional regulator
MKARTAVREAEVETLSDDFKLDDFLPHRLAVAATRVNRLLSRRFEEASGVSIPEWRVLAVVARFGVLSPSVVGERTSMDKVKVSRAAASLVARGLLKQSQDPTDGRGRLLRLTRKGAGACNTLMPLARALEDDLSHGLGRAEWATLQKALVRLDQHVQAIEEPEETAEAAD